MHTKKLAIIAGGGNLPLQVIKQLKKDKREFIIIALKGIGNANDFAEYETYSFYPGQARKVLSTLKKQKVKEIVFAGNVKRPSIFDVRLDAISYKILLKSFIGGFGDDGLLRLVMAEMEAIGVKIVGAHEICPHLTLSKGDLGKTKPNKADEANIKKGIEVLKAMGDLDIGQSIIVDTKVVLGVEAIEGTEELIKRCGKHKLSEKGGVLVKMKKTHQTDKVDMPTIGVKTIEQISLAGFSGIAIESGNVLVVDQKEVVKKANELKIFIKAF